MARKRYSPEQIIGYPREAEVLLPKGSTVLQICRKIGIAEQTFYSYGGLPGFIRSDNGPEFTSYKQSEAGWNDQKFKPCLVNPASPWENGYNESFNGKLRDELLNGEIFTTLLEANVLIENQKKEYNQFRPHSSLNYQPPAPETINPKVEILT